MRKKANMDIREALKEARVPYWRVADKMDISEGTLCCRLRRELSAEQKREILEIIEHL